MKILFYSDACKIVFEDKDSFAGKSLRIAGEWVEETLLFNSDIKWLVSDETGIDCEKPVDDGTKAVLIPYIIEEASKQNCTLKLWS